MLYVGSKNKIAKYILPIILQNAKPDTVFIDLFCGGCNLIDKINLPAIANDSNHYLISLFEYVLGGYPLPDIVGEEEYLKVKENKNIYPDWYIAFVGICCSYGGKWFGGYARNKRGDNYAQQSKNNLLKQKENLKHILFSSQDYRNVYIPNNAIVYADKPYSNTISYKDKFDHTAFWDYARDISAFNPIFISEYTAPEDFLCVWSQEISTNYDSKNKRIEKLFVPYWQLEESLR